MDRRIIILIAVFFVVSLSFFLYRKFFHVYEGIAYEIRPNSVINVNDSITYVDRTPGANRWKWDFGDGEFSTEQAGRHSYLLPGQFNIKLTVYGPFGVLKANSQKYVTPIAVSIESRIVGSPDMKVNHPASYESNTTADSYEWRIEGTPASESQLQQGKAATFNFKNSGTRTILLTMHNPDQTVSKAVRVMPDTVIVIPRQTVHNKPHTHKNNDHTTDRPFDPHGEGVDLNK